MSIFKFSPGPISSFFFSPDIDSRFRLPINHLSRSAFLLLTVFLTACGGGGGGGGEDTSACLTEPTSVNFASVEQNDGSLAPRELSVNGSCQATGTDSEGNSLDFLIANDGTFEFAYNPLINASALGEATVSGAISANGSVAYTVCSQFESERFCITYDGVE